MSTTITISSRLYEHLRRQAAILRSTPEKVAETLLRLQLENSAHIELRPTAHGAEAYVRGSRVAVRHIAAFLEAGYPVEEIVDTVLPHLSAAAIYEAIAYYHDHHDEIEAELQANEPPVIQAQLRQLLSPEQYLQLTGQPA